MRQIIAIYSPAPQMGKSTIARHLVDKHGYTRVPFASVLKDMVRPLYRAFGYTEDQIECFETFDKTSILHAISPDCTPRKLYQTLGTEWGRNIIDKNIWLNAWQNKVKATAGDIVVDDLRFPNEWGAVKVIGGTTVRIERQITLSAPAHSSEGGLAEFDFDYTISNDGTREELVAKVDNLTQLIHYSCLVK